jgi:glycerophosphoryl diester phosphodiesterase
VPPPQRLTRSVCRAALALLLLLPFRSAWAQDLPTIEAFPFYIRSAPSTQRLAARVATLAREFPPLPAIPDAKWRNQRIDIVLAPSEQALQFATGGRVPEWGAGVAIPDRSLIVLPAYASVERGTLLDFSTVLRHELAHIALHRAVAPAPIPRWFDEGYASWAAHELDASSAWMLRLAFALGRAPPLDSLELTWPTGNARAQLAYLLSASVIEYLVAESGTYGLERFLQRWQESGDFQGALGATYGLDLPSLESHWVKFVKRRYGWTVVLSQTLAFGSFAGLIVLVLYLLRRRRDKAKLAAMVAAEVPPAPAFWTETGAEIIAHRGYSARAPENTLAAMQLALERGAPALEFDIRATRDGVPVLFHDETLERTTNGHGRLADLSFRELNQLDAGSWFSAEFENERVPALAEVLQAAWNRVNRLYVELKPGGLTARQLRQVVEELALQGFVHHCVVMSFDWSLLEAVRGLSPDITLAFLADDESAFRRAVARAVADGNALVDCNYKILLANPELANLAERSGIELAVYTVNDTATAAALLRQGVRRITTNEVERLLKWSAGRDFTEG